MAKAHLQDISHILSVRVLPQEATRSNDDVDTVYASFDGNSRIVHVASDVCKDLALQSQLADRFAVPSALLGCSGRSQLDVLDAKVGQGGRDLDLGLGVEEGIGEL